MVININLTDKAGNPIRGAKVVHYSDSCCGYSSKTSYKSGYYRVNIFTTNVAGGHIITASAPGYKTQTGYFERGYFETENWYRTIKLDPYPGENTEIQLDEPGIGGNAWKINDHDRIAMQCSALAVSTKKPCRNRTIEEFCYQHKHIVTPEMKKYAGKWKMFGRQLNIERSGWEADLEMLASGKVKWQQTKGANVGAKRTGCWALNDDTIIIRYLAPIVGRVEWQTIKITTENMNGIYRTPDISSDDCGWGGEWNASKCPKQD